MPLRLFITISNARSLAGVFLHGMTFVLCTFYLPLHFQGVMGATALLSGVWLLPFAGAMSFSALVPGLYVEATGRFLETIWIGSILTTLGFELLINLNVEKNWVKILMCQFIADCGVGPNSRRLKHLSRIFFQWNFL